MATFIAILRGINVSGARKLPMAGLRKLFEDMGCTDVRTYIQSGNVVFAHAKAKPEDLASTAQKRIAKEFGHGDVPVLILARGEMERVIRDNPLLKERSIDPDRLHVTFLAADPGNNAERSGINGPDRYVRLGRRVYLHCPEGYGRTKLNNTFFERLFHREATTRNWRTVNELARMAQAG